MTIAKPYPSDPSLRDSRVADGESLPVTAPTAAPGGDPSPNSVRAREEGLGVKPSVVEDNLNALSELAAAEPEPETFTVDPEPEKAPAKKRAPRKAAAKKAPAKKAAAKKAAK